jgi:hypothetical protein
MFQQKWVLGAGSWTLEIKAENVDIDRDAIEQAITYARHPQVSGSYAPTLRAMLTKLQSG